MVLGDLDPEVEKSLDTSPEAQSGKKRKYIPLYVHSGKDKRLAISRQDFSYV